MSPCFVSASWPVRKSAVEWLVVVNAAPRASMRGIFSNAIGDRRQPSSATNEGGAHRRQQCPIARCSAPLERRSSTTCMPKLRAATARVHTEPEAGRGGSWAPKTCRMKCRGALALLLLARLNVICSAARGAAELRPRSASIDSLPGRLRCSERPSIVGPNLCAGRRTWHSPGTHSVSYGQTASRGGDR